VNAPPTPTVRIWLVIGDKLGDNAQVKIIADSLGLPYETRRLLPKEVYRLGKPRFRISLEHLDLEHSDPLQPPWPDLVITTGRRHSMAALWIKAQHPATQVVLLGRPRRWIEKFDLVITLPQYRLPERPNVMRLTLPLIRADHNAVARAAESWRMRFTPLQKPLIAVLVGGPTRPYRFDAAVTAELLDLCGQLQARYGGTLYVSTSRRTTAAIATALRAHLPHHAVLHEWTSGGGDNPYLALLGLADYFVVTGDSVSMMMEVADCGKPLAIFALPADWKGRLWQRLLLRLHGRAAVGPTGVACHWLGRLLYRTGVAGFARDLGAVHQQLIDAGFAVRAGDPFPAAQHHSLPVEVTEVADRIKALVEITAN
jgi:mitochondrial fission protein ELM1